MNLASAGTTFANYVGFARIDYEDEILYLVQIFLPLYDNKGVKFPRAMYQQLSDELTHRFGGLTGYTRAPVEGHWQDHQEGTRRDDLVIYECMTPNLDRAWWHTFRLALQKHFRQQQLLVRAQNVEQL